MAQLLIYKGANTTVLIGDKVAKLAGAKSIIFRALSHDPKTLEYVINKGADVSIPDGASYTHLMRAVLAEKVELVQVLLEYNAKIDAKNSKGQTSLMIAIEKKNAAMVDLLIKNGANVLAVYNYYQITSKKVAGNMITKLLKDKIDELEYTAIHSDQITCSKTDHHLDDSTHEFGIMADIN